MKRALAVIVAAAVVLIFVYVAWLNPKNVEVHLGGQDVVSVQLGWLLVVSFLAGLVVAIVLAGLVQAARTVRAWPQQRQARQVQQTAEWERAGHALAWEGDLQRARSLLARARRRQPNRPGPALALAASYTDTGEFDAARRVLSEAVSHNAADPDLRFALGETARHGGDLAEAIRIFETVRVQHPRAPSPLRTLRDLYRQAGRWQEAKEVQDAYLQTVPPGTYAEKQRRLLTRFAYQAAVSIRNPDGRAEALLPLAQGDPSFVAATISLGDALREAGRPNEAIKVWERALRNNPRTVLVRRILAQQTTPRDRQRTLALLKKSRQPLDAEAVQMITARAALDTGDLDSAALALEAVAGTCAPAQRLWAEIHSGRGRWEEAAKALAAAEQEAAEAREYSCTACERASAEWSGYCPTCGAWDTYRAPVEPLTTTG